VLSLYFGSLRVTTNTGWGSAPNAAAIREAAHAVGAFPLAENSRDSALLVTLEPGAYSLHVSDAAGASGIALVELYEVP